MKVYISYGWSEGQRQGKALRRALHAAGYVVTKDAEIADVIIAHSGGCYMLPPQTKARLILMVGLPYWPDKHPVRSLQEKLRNEVRDMWWYKNTVFNMYYLFTRPARWIRMYRSWKRQMILNANNSLPVILVRNERDYFTHPTDVMDLADAKSWQLQTLPGHHDDLWVNPEPYVHIIATKLKQ